MRDRKEASVKEIREWNKYPDSYLSLTDLLKVININSTQALVFVLFFDRYQAPELRAEEQRVDLEKQMDDIQHTVFYRVPRACQKYCWILSY